VKQEHRVVAELYGYMAAFVDPDRPIYLSLDGVAAERGVKEGLFKDPDVPDMVFTLVDGREVAIEVKILYGKRIGTGLGQYNAWFGSGAGAHKPTGWVVADEKLSSFFYWSHGEMVKQRTTPPGASEKKSVKIPVPTTTPMFPSLRHLALHVVRFSP
jgi:hypothetical protein